MTVRTVWPVPALGDIGLISLDYHRWEAPWQSIHHLLSGISRYFHVVWCNPPWSWRSLGQRDTPAWDPRIFGGSVTPALTVYEPEKWLPAIGRPGFLARWTRRERLRRARALLRARGCRRIVLFLSLPEYGYALDEADHDLSCYRVSDEYTFSATERPIDESEAHLMSRVDRVFVLSQAMLEKKGHLNPATLWVPNGVDYAAYATEHGEPPDLAAVPHPRIGYVGVIKDQLDLPLLATLARRHAAWSFVLVGPKGMLRHSTAVLEALLALPNVYWLGAKPLGALPGYVQHLDVCMLIYRLDGYTKFVYPLKLHAYLASGRPVVGAPIRTLQDFSCAVRLAETPDEWSRAISELLAPDAVSRSAVEDRRRIARRHDWSGLVAMIVRNICESLGSTYLSRFDTVSGGLTD
jgi:Glycosyl transferases group 1